MTRKDAQSIIDIMAEKEDYELVISKQRDVALDDYNTVFNYAWSTKNDKVNKWEHDFQDIYCNDYSEEEIIEKLIECDKYMILNATKTILCGNNHRKEREIKNSQ